MSQMGRASVILPLDVLKRVQEIAISDFEGKWCRAARQLIRMGIVAYDDHQKIFKVPTPRKPSK